MARERLETGDVRLAWEPTARLVSMSFRPGADPGGEEAAACVAALLGWSGGEPVGMLIDCADLSDTRAGWRAVFADAAAAAPPGLLRFAWFSMSPRIAVTVDMFLRATGMDGAVFPGEAGARAWLASGASGKRAPDVGLASGELAIEDVLGALALASIGRVEQRVPVPEGADVADDATRFAIAANILLSDLAYREKRLQAALADLRRANATLETRVAERTRDLERANDELRAFNATVAHDLRAPLRAVGHLTEVIVEDFGQRLGDDGVAVIESVHRSALRMSRLVDDLLAFSRAGQADLHRQVVDLSELAEEVFEELRSQERDRRVVTTVAPALRVLGDPRLLGVALTNLLGNAWKFTRRVPEARIDVSGAPSTGDGMLVVAVRDNGAGFDATRAHRLFEPFRRLHAANDYEGTGLGLATVRRVVERHGGRVWAEAVPGHGATFYMSIPAAPADRAP